jgi:Tol biopolymer transport system component
MLYKESPSALQAESTVGAMTLGVGFAALLAASQATLTFGISISETPRALCLADRGGQHRLTAIVDQSEPSWSPDGAAYVFASVDGIGIADARGNAVRVLNPPDAGELRYDPAWSPTGNWIAFATGYYGQVIELVSPDGTRSQTVPGTSGGLETETASPTWWPDGMHLDYAYAASDPGAGASGIYAIAIDGSGRRLVVPNAEDPALSPDGTRLAYVKTTWTDATSVNHDIFVASADGTSEERLTFTAKLDERHPVWSPDGRTLAFDVGNARIDEIQPSIGGERTVVRAAPGFSLTPPAWRPVSAAPAGRSQRCVIEGTPKADKLAGTKLDDIIVGGNGNDTIHGGAGNDLIVGGAGHDHLYGGAGDDTFFAQDKWLDWIDGNTGNDTAYCDFFDKRRNLDHYCYF